MKRRETESREEGRWEWIKRGGLWRKWKKREEESADERREEQCGEKKKAKQREEESGAER